MICSSPVNISTTSVMDILFDQSFCLSALTTCRCDEGECDEGEGDEGPSRTQKGKSGRDVRGQGLKDCLGSSSAGLLI